MAGLFITATGTDAGKTLFTAALAWQLREHGRAVKAVKPVVSGFSPSASDTATLLQAQGIEPDEAALDATSPWRYAEPVSPHLAGMGDASLTAANIAAFCRQALTFDGTCLIEGAGGIMTPLVRGYTQADLAEELGIPVILLTGSYLGCISHSLTALEVLERRRIPVQAVVVNGHGAGEEQCETDRASIAAHVPVALPVFTLPEISPKTEPLWQHLPPLTALLT